MDLIGQNRQPRSRPVVRPSPAAAVFVHFAQNLRHGLLKTKQLYLRILCNLHKSLGQALFV
jgi:hypothetical protein